MLAISQLPTVLASERVATIVSLITVIVFAGGLFVIASSSCTAILFAVLLAVHAMLPISRITSFIVTGVLLMQYLILFRRDHRTEDDMKFFQQVNNDAKSSRLIFRKIV